MSNFTARARTFMLVAIVFYLFANQTQVGWLYVMAAVIAGTLFAGVWLSRGTLHGIDARRQLGSSADAELYEGGPINIALSIRRTKSTGVSQVRVTETCP